MMSQSQKIERVVKTCASVIVFCFVCFAFVLVISGCNKKGTNTPVKPDVTPPAPVTDLAVGRSMTSSLTLTWEAPGDDGIYGQATEYDIRFSTAPITDTNWNSTTQVTGEPAPGTAYSSQSFVVMGLNPNTSYYFALKTRDEVPDQWSSLSNVVGGTTAPGTVILSLDATLNMPNAWAVEVVGNYAYVAEYEGGGLQIINIANPQAPILVGACHVGSSGGGPGGLAVDGNYAYLAGDDLYIFNITNPHAPTLASHYNTPGSAWGVAVAGDYAYVADGVAGLSIIKIVDPQAPTLVGSYNTTGTAYSIALADSYAYIADGIQVVDISNPFAPTLVGNSNTWGGGTAGLALFGNYVYYATTEGLKIIDISNPFDPIQIVVYDSHQTEDVAVDGIYAYLARVSCLEIINITDPTKPIHAGSCDILSFPYSVTVHGNNIYIVDGNSLFVFRLTPYTP